VEDGFVTCILPFRSLIESQMSTAHFAICLSKQRCTKGAFERKPSRQSARAALAVERRSYKITPK